MQLYHALSFVFRSSMTRTLKNNTKQLKDRVISYHVISIAQIDTRNLVKKINKAMQVSKNSVKRWQSAWCIKKNEASTLIKKCCPGLKSGRIINPKPHPLTSHSITVIFIIIWAISSSQSIALRSATQCQTAVICIGDFGLWANDMHTSCLSVTTTFNLPSSELLCHVYLSSPISPLAYLDVHFLRVRFDLIGTNLLSSKNTNNKSLQNRPS